MDNLFDIFVPISARSSRPKVVYKKGVLINILQNSHENTCAGVLF